MSFTPTAEQSAIVDAAKSTKDSLLINALAGASKTTTLVMVANAVVVPTFCGAFNKKIADEMGRRLPGHVQSSTMNSIGHRVWGQTIGKRLVVQTDKVYNDVRAFSETLNSTQKSYISENFAAIMRAVRLAKSAGYVPERARSMGKSLVLDFDELSESLYNHIDCDIDEPFVNAVDEVLLRGIAESYQALIDFDDQIYMSTLFGGNYPRYPLVMIDEAQDLSPLNHVTLSKLYGGRLIAVGDPWQSIYGFRGAHTSSMAALQSQFDMRSMELTISFRCPQTVVRKAHQRVPHMKWPDWAEEGKVETLSTWSTSEIPDGAAIICRNNAPLFACAMQLIRSGRGIHLVGNDIGQSLVKLMKKICPTEIPANAFIDLIEDWRASELKKAAPGRHASINDRAECLRVFAEVGSTSKEATAYAEHLFAASGPIQMMTGHKAKGLEFDIVYHLNPFLIPSKHARMSAEAGDNTQMEQELNLRYVIETRAKKELYLVDLEGLE